MSSSGVLFCPQLTDIQFRSNKTHICKLQLYNINVCLSHGQNVQIIKVTAAYHLKPTAVVW